MNTVAVGKRIALKNILFATDFSPCSNVALSYALSVARRYGATLHAAHVMPTEADMLYLSPESWQAASEEENQIVSRYVDQLENQLRGLPHRVLTPRGRVADALAEVVEACQIDLLVLGTHGRTGVRKLLMGSVAEEVFRRAACPVLSVGPNVFRKPHREAEFQGILFATDFSPASLAALPYAISLAEEDEARLWLLHVVGQPAAGIADLEATTSFLLRRLRELIPPEAEPWCHSECLVEFGELFASPVERILQVAEERAVDLIVLGVRPVRSNVGLVTHLASTTAQILTQAACPVLSVRG